MALVDVYPTYWLRCRPHGALFAAIDTIWGQPGESNHLNCVLDNVYGQAVVIINDPEYDPRDRDKQRVLCCSECRGHGTVEAVLVALRTGEPSGELLRLTCGGCRGWGYR